MGKVIIITTPRPTQGRNGLAIVASTDQGDARPGPNLMVEFSTELPNMNIGDIAEGRITSPGPIQLTSMVGPSTWAQGRVTRTQVPDEGGHIRSEFQVDTLCDPNPFGVVRGQKLMFNDTNSEAKVGDTVACIPTVVGGTCEVMKVLTPA